MQLDSLQRKLAYQFQDTARLTMALTHRSVPGNNNERLEFLGDALLSFVIGEQLYTRFPTATEGQLSQMRSHLVKGSTLATISEELRLGDYLIMGPGELKTGGHRRSSTLANALEALAAAIYLDGGLTVCRQVVLTWFEARLQKLTVNQVILKDAKSQLQEWLQARKFSLPVYTVCDVSGQIHEQMFTIRCELAELNCVEEGTGASRRKAEQAAASKMLTQLKQCYDQKS
jgi:ribonuclease III